MKLKQEKNDILNYEKRELNLKNIVQAEEFHKIAYENPESCQSP